MKGGDYLKRIKKQYGTWYYKKRVPNIFNRLEGTIYLLYSSRKRLLNIFSTYEDMIDELEKREFIEKLKVHYPFEDISK